MSSGRLQDMSSRCLYDMSSRLLKDDFSVTIFLLPRCLQDVFGRHLQDLCVLEGEKLLRWRLVEDKTSSKPTKICWDKASEMHIGFFSHRLTLRTKKGHIKRKPPSIQTSSLKLSKKTWIHLLTFYVQTLTTFSNHLCSHLA